MKQRGSMVLYAIIVMMVLTAIGLMAYQIKRLEGKNERLSEQVATLTKERDDALDKVDNLNKELDLSRKLADASKEQVNKHVQEIQQLNKKIQNLQSNFPKTQPRDTSKPIDPEQEKRSVKRIMVLWDIYCLDETLPGCIKNEVKENPNEKPQARAVVDLFDLSGRLYHHPSSSRELRKAGFAGTGCCLPSGLPDGGTAFARSICNDEHGRARGCASPGTGSGIQLSQGMHANET